ncbi:hypothetical protein LLG46_02520 [bacterium]|nr:hypothetical protein [bacterium]
MYSPAPKTAPIFAIIAVLMSLLFITGCGNSSSDAQSPTFDQPPASNATQVLTPTSTVQQKLKFSQLTLETPAKSTKDKNGLEFLVFQYADNSGKVYKCKLPKAMSEGEYTPDQWVATFSAYQESDVIKQKKAMSSDGQAVKDFPFIAPKPVKENTQTQGDTGTGQMPTPP